MKHINTLLLIIFLIFEVFAQNAAGDRLGYIVKLEPGSEQKIIQPVTKDQFSGQLTWQKISETLHIYRVEWEEEITDEEIEDYFRKLPGVIDFHKNLPVSSRGEGIRPGDPMFDDQWWLERIKANIAWTQSQGGIDAIGDTLVIAILEREGAYLSHEDFRADLFWKNAAEIPGDGIDNDNNGYIDDYKGLNLVNQNDTHTPELSPHATPIIGIVGAGTDNNKGVAGINWHVKVLFISGVTDIGRIIEGYNYVFQMRRRYNESNGTEGAKVVVTNLSLGVDGLRPSDFPFWCEMYNELGALGILSIGSTSNLNIDVDVAGDLPSNCESDYLIIVTTTTEDDKRGRTGFGATSVDLGAPGEGILTTYPLNDYQPAFGGTSAAAPVVAGGVALLYSMPNSILAENILSNPPQSALMVKKAILDGVDPIEDLKGRTVSGGRLNLSNSMQILAENYETRPSPVSILRLSPNPVTSELSLIYNSSIVDRRNEVLIFDVMGKLMLSDSSYPSIFGETVHTINVSGLMPGTYILTIRNGKQADSAVFVKMH